MSWPLKGEFFDILMEPSWLDAVADESVGACGATSVKLTEDGKKALLKLSKGDMRRALNILQACHAAYDQTGETEVYNCTGSPEPADIETVCNSMITDEFTTSYQSTFPTTSKLPRHIVLRTERLIGLLMFCPCFIVVTQLKTERGLALQDLLIGAYEYIEGIDFPPAARIYLLDHLATTEYVPSVLHIRSST